MSRYTLTKKAVQDLRQIWNYTYDHWSENQADKYYFEILQHCARIADNPLMGKKYDGLVPGLRGSGINKHIVFYRQITDSEIEIARILHENMDLETRLPYI